MNTIRLNGTTIPERRHAEQFHQAIIRRTRLAWIRVAERTGILLVMRLSSLKN